MQLQLGARTKKPTFLSVCVSKKINSTRARLSCSLFFSTTTKEKQVNLCVCVSVLVACPTRNGYVISGGGNKSELIEKRIKSGCFLARSHINQSNGWQIQLNARSTANNNTTSAQSHTRSLVRCLSSNVHASLSLRAFKQPTSKAKK